MKRFYLSGSKTLLKYNSDWSMEVPSSQLVSYSDYAMEFVENTMTQRVSSVELAKELCMETTISSEKSVEAVIIVLVAHDPGWADGHPEHGRYGAAECQIEARIIRSGEDVYAIRLFGLRYGDHRDQMFICTLRKSHPVTGQLQYGDKLRVYARSRFLRVAITVMQGKICVAHEEQHPDLRATFGNLYLRDSMSKSFGTWPSKFFRAFETDQLYIKVPAIDEYSGVFQCTHFFEYRYGHYDHLPLSSIVRLRHICLPIIRNSVHEISERSVLCTMIVYHDTVACGGCGTVISKVGWYCKKCQSLDLCGNCYTELPENVSRERPDHSSDHLLEELEEPDRNPVEHTAPYRNWGNLISVGDGKFHFSNKFGTPLNEPYHAGMVNLPSTLLSTFPWCTLLLNPSSESG